MSLALDSTIRALTTKLARQEAAVKLTQEQIEALTALKSAPSKK